MNCSKLGRLFAFAAGLVVAASAPAATITNKIDAAGGWADGASWEGGVAPVGGDDVVITGRMALVDADAPTAALVSKIEICKGSSLLVDNAETLVVTGLVNGAGSLVKNGVGMLDLPTPLQMEDKWGTAYGYQLGAGWVVSNGVVRFPYSPGYGANNNSFMAWMLGHVEVWAPGIVDVPAFCNLYMDNVVGDGAFLNSGAAKPAPDGATFMTQLRFKGTSVLDGPLLGNDIRVYTAGLCTFNCPTSTIVYSEFATWGGMLAMPIFGTTGQLSPSGPSATIKTRDFGGKILYTGTDGETTDRTFAFSTGAKTKPSEFDAGEYGGVTFTGTIGVDGGGAHWDPLYLMGDNAQPMTIAGIVQEYSAGTTYWIKKGTGTWRFADSADNSSRRQQKGIYDVRNGTLAFDSVADTGAACALGPQTMLVPESNAYGDVATRVDYSFLLGYDAATIGTLAYVGTGRSDTDRRIAVQHKGRLASDGGTLAWHGGAYAIGSDSTLVLGGTSARVGRIDNLSDGADGKSLALEKDGAGTWALGTNCTFTGKATVKEGTLRAIPPKARYTWFKWRIRETQNGYYRRHDGADPKKVTDTNVGARQIAFFDAAGNNLALGAFTEDFSDDASKLQPWYMTYDPTSGNAVGRYTSGNPADAKTGDEGRNLNRLVDGLASEWLVYPNAGTMVRNDVPNSWISVVFRFPDDVAEIVGFDFYSYGAANGRAVVAWDLFGSENGSDWTMLESKDLETSPGNWYADAGAAVKCETRTLDAEAGNYLAFDDGDESADYRGAPWATATEVWPGATFAVGREGVTLPLPGSLAVTNGGVYGSYSGFAIPETGTIDVGEEPTWFRVTVRETGYGRIKREDPDNKTVNDPNVQMQEFALYDVDGVRRNLGLQLDNRYDPAALEPGFFTYDRGGYDYYTNRDADKLFDDKTVDSGWCIHYNGKYVRQDEPSSWLKLTVRLPEIGRGIRSCDWVAHATGWGRTVVDFTLEASLDGVHWTQVYEKVAEENDLVGGTWWSDGAAFAAGQKRFGFPLDATAFSNLGGGSAEELSATIDFSGCTGVENFKNWKVRVNGIEKPRTRVVYRDGKIQQIVPGTVLVIR